jgi:hypothetical protein
MIDILSNSFSDIYFNHVFFLFKGSNLRLKFNRFKKNLVLEEKKKYNIYLYNSNMNVVGV